jgi:hypothetical protein
VAVAGGLAAVALVLAAYVRLRRTWPDAVEPVALALPLLAAVAVAGGAAPRAAGQSAAALVALRAEPHRLPDPAGRGVLFHALAWPAALVVGEAAAVRVVAAVSAAAGLLFGYALFRSSALDPAAALAGQAALAVVPVAALGAGRALFVHALPQALEVLLLAHLVRRLGHLEGARDNAAAFGYLVLAQAASVVAALEVALLAAAAALAEAATGQGRRALRLALSGTLATAAVFFVLSVPRLLDWPARALPAAAAVAWTPSALGLTALAGAMALALLPDRTRAPRLLAAGVVAGLAAVVLAADVDDGAATLPGLGLLAPAAACVPAALVARLRSRSTDPAAPGSRS